ncbi:MAG: 3-oxoacyl-ACP reductase FabG [Bacillota bacterium]
MRLKDKVAIVTGGGRGIGEATAVRFAQEGANVVVADVNEQNIAEVTQKIQALGQEALGLIVDVTNGENVDEMIRKTLDKFGKIDILVNNAGITADAQLLKMTEEQFDKVIAVNLKGVYNCGQAAAKVMAEQEKGGVILNASSIVGVYGNFGQTNYAATKWGVIGMTKTWAKELGRKGIRVNAVAPGYTMTPMLDSVPEKVIDMLKAKSPLGRLGSSEDIANAYLYLASDEAAFVTGEVLCVDGGAVL